MKINMEIVYDDGTKTTVSFEGALTKKRVLQMIEALDFQPTPAETSSRLTSQDFVQDIAQLSDETLTIKERLKLLLRYESSGIWFTSKEAKVHYERTFEHIPLSTVSTYLGRMYRAGILERRGSRVQREYRYVSKAPEEQEAAQGIPLHL